MKRHFCSNMDQSEVSGSHQQDVRHDGPVHGQERLSEEDEDLRTDRKRPRQRWPPLAAFITTHSLRLSLQACDNVTATVVMVTSNSGNRKSEHHTSCSL